MALSAYRNVLRAARIAFQGDAPIFSAAKIEARSKFNGSRSLPAGSDEAQQKIIEAQEVARILRQNVVQGHQVGGLVDKEQRYQLRIHEETERGDNDSIKKGTNLTSAGGACCGGTT
ncbi:hypothetical protein N7G274_008509 [Stereocaulon virgatum]|uniref:Mitochondrial zinc maintenance protein 1, mitochondrial n=1 Tax=Stereocaulon virgatum TaxID=373712 RepID=A0ABR4A1C7_9LECA